MLLPFVFAPSTKPTDKIQEHFLFYETLETKTRGEDMFKMINKFFIENRIDWSHLQPMALKPCMTGYIS